VAWAEHSLHPNLRDLVCIEVLVAKFLLGLSIHKILARLDEVQVERNLFVLLQIAFLGTGIDDGWMKQAIC
jgi:hypothetical protein